jgi:hypothetical protein
VLPVYFNGFQAVLLGYLSNLRTRKPGSTGSPDPLRAPFWFLMQLQDWGGWQYSSALTYACDPVLNWYQRGRGACRLRH